MLKSNVLISLFKMHASICDDCWINLVGVLLLLFGFVFSVLSVFYCRVTLILEN